MIKTRFILILITILIIVIDSCSFKKDYVIYQIQPTDGSSVEYMAFSKQSLDPQFISEKILNGEFSTTSEKITSLEKEIGIDSGYVWHVTFSMFEEHIDEHKNKTYLYDQQVLRIPASDIKEGKVLSIASTNAIPLKWPGWWGMQFHRNIRLEQELHKWKG